MARKSKVNRSEAIRELLGQNPRMSTNEIMDTLKARGVVVSRNLIYLVKAKNRSRRRKLRRAKAMNAGRQAGIKDPLSFILRVKALAYEAGGLKQFKQFVDALAE